MKKNIKHQAAKANLMKMANKKPKMAMGGSCVTPKKLPKSK